jgi:hypothetical protein
VKNGSAKVDRLHVALVQQQRQVSQSEAPGGQCYDLSENLADIFGNFDSYNCHFVQNIKLLWQFFKKGPNRQMVIITLTPKKAPLFGTCGICTYVGTCVRVKDICQWLTMTWEIKNVTFF